MKFSIILFSTIFAPLSCFAFLDIAPTDPQIDIFSHLQDIKVMTAFQDGNFYPEKTVTRAEALKIALMSGNIAIPLEFSGKTYFSDVDPNIWYAPIIARAAELKLINLQNQFFRPNDAVTKAEFLAFLFRTTRVNFTPFFSDTSPVALDVPKDAWFAPHFAYAKKYQISLLPEDNLYRPFKVLTRREVAMMTFRQLRIFHGDESTKNTIELQAQISQFITLLKSDKRNEAEFRLQRIIELTNMLARTKNDKNAVGAAAISQAMSHFSDSLSAFKFGKNLVAIENLHIASKFAERAAEKSDSIKPFANDLLILINETLVSYNGPKNLRVSQK